MTRRKLISMGALALLASSACRKKTKAPPIAHLPTQPATRGPGRTSAPPPPPPEPGWSETGIASWYGYPYHGRRAANGEVYDMNQLTAAHRTLPFGAMVRVTSLTNGKSVTVRITDRGPFIEGRVIDLSHEGAKEIDMIGPGVMKVRLEITSYGPARLNSPTTVARNTAPPTEPRVAPRTAPTEIARTPKSVAPAPALPPAPDPSLPALPAPQGGSFGVQVGLFNNKPNAERLVQRLERRYHPVDLVAREGERTQWRVIVGLRDDEASAEKLAAELRHNVGEAMVVRRD